MADHDGCISYRVCVALTGQGILLLVNFLIYGLFFSSYNLKYRFIFMEIIFKGKLQFIVWCLQADLLF